MFLGFGTTAVTCIGALATWGDVSLGVPWLGRWWWVPFILDPGSAYLMACTVIYWLVVHKQ
jgi:hypothetical protein